MAEKLIVGISDLKIAQSPDTLVTYALGSCVGICIFDSAIKLAGMAHILLPDSTFFPDDKNAMKFADTSIDLLITDMKKNGALKSRMKAKIAGGAQLFAHDSSNDLMRIGNRNVTAVKKKLLTLGIVIVAEDTGKDYGRTVEIFPDSGLMKISSALKGIKML